MAEIQKVNGRNVTNYMARDFDSFMQSMREMIPDKLPEWKEFESEADFGNVLLQLFAHMGDILSYYQDRIANESFLGTAQTRRSIIHHLRLIGYRLGTAAPASTILKLNIPAGCEEVITIKRGDAFSTKSQKDLPSVRFEYNGVMPLMIECKNLVVNPATNQKHFTGIPVEEGRLVDHEILGVSNGMPDQKFMLAHTGLILRPLGIEKKINRDIILITELDGYIEEWTLQESLAFSRGSQNDFVIEIDEFDRATVIFGDGLLGAIPANGAKIKATYRVGGGKRGNVTANSITTIINAPQLSLIGAQVTNEKPATGGAERESIDHAVMHAPKVFRSLKRAVTMDDYKALALNFKSVGKVRAAASNWNTVTLYVAPKGGGKVSDVLESNILGYFEDKRPVSTVIEIADADYVEIYVTAEVGVKSFYTQEDIREKVRLAVTRLLAFDNVDFGEKIYLSKLYESIEAIEGVEYVNITEFRHQCQSPGYVEETGKIELGINEVPVSAYPGGIKIDKMVGGI